MPAEHYSHDSFMLLETPFNLSNEGKIAVSVDYITKKWAYYYPEKWRKSRAVKNIEDYKRYLNWELDGSGFTSFKKIEKEL